MFLPVFYGLRLCDTFGANELKIDIKKRLSTLLSSPVEQGEASFSAVLKPHTTLLWNLYVSETMRRNLWCSWFYFLRLQMGANCAVWSSPLVFIWRSANFLLHSIDLLKHLRGRVHYSPLNTKVCSVLFFRTRGLSRVEVESILMKKMDKIRFESFQNHFKFE